MKSHLDNLIYQVPNILSGITLDLGSGKGIFLLDIAKRNGSAVGLEINKEYIKSSLESAKRNNLKIEIKQGVAERLPFDDLVFNFINISEVIEHVNSPKQMISETWRVLKKEGQVYLSVPNRYSLRDPHFHLYFVNWLPRSLCNFYIGLFGKHKDYNGNAGVQNLKDMHYYTYSRIKNLLKKEGFNILDTRERKIEVMFKNKVIRFFALFLYKIARFFYFDSFHFLLKK